MSKESYSLPAIRLALFFLLSLLVNAVMDGLPTPLLAHKGQVLLIPFTVAFLAAFFYFMQPARLASGIQKLASKAYWRSSLWLTTFFVAVGYVVFLYEAHYYQRVGYRLYPIRTTVIFVAVISGLIFLQGRLQISARTIFGVILASYLAIELFSIFSFPLNIHRSDMFSMIQVEAGDLAKGHNPYHLYTSPETDYCAYFPVLLASYIPGVLLHLDLRLIATVYMVLLAVLIFLAARPEHRRTVAGLIGTFLLCNYVIYRHEMYLQIHWLVLAAMAVLVSRGRLFSAALVLGVAIGTSQLTLAIFPFLLLHAWQKENLGKALQATAITLGTAALLLVPFAVWKPNTMIYGVAGRYYSKSVLNVRPMNLVYWLAHIVPPDHMKWIQMAVLVTIFAYAVLKNRCRDASGCLGMMMVAFLAFILLNPLLDGYFYLTFLVLAMSYLCTVNGWWVEGPVVSGI